MGLFDRIKGDTEEVELQVPHNTSGTERNASRRVPSRQPDRAAEEEDEERFLLPGMAPQAVEESEDDALPETDDMKELLGRIVQQNERIIRLLEGEEEEETDAGIDGIL